MRPDEINKGVSMNREHNQGLSPRAPQQEEVGRRAGVNKGKEEETIRRVEVRNKRVWSLRKKEYGDGMIHSVKCCSDIRSKEVQELTITFINLETPGDFDRGVSVDLQVG